MSHLTPAILPAVAALSMREPPGPSWTNLSLNMPSKNFASPLKYASFASLSRARSAAAVGAAAVGRAALVFALLADVSPAGAPQAAKDTAVTAIKIDKVVLFNILSPFYPLGSSAHIR